MLSKNKAFTLIELLVVIVIIGVLSGIGVVMFNGYIDKTEKAKIEADLAPFIKAVQLGRILEEKTLREITGNGCSDCVCRTGEIIYNFPETHSCKTNWEDLLNRLSESSNIDLENIKRDPWGSPYLLDENEGESESNLCRRDKLRSAGPDGIVGTADDIKSPIEIPFYNNSLCGF